MITTVKRGDTHPVELTVNHDLTGATLRVVIRHLTVEGVLEVISDPTVDDASAGVVSFLVDEWEPGPHYVELEIKQGAETRTSPTRGYLVIHVERDLD